MRPRKVTSPDGSRIAYASARKGNRDIVEQKTSGASGQTSILETLTDEWPEDWSKDGRYLAYSINLTQGLGTHADIYALPLFGNRKPFPIVQSPYTDDEPRFSFDGKWLAYNSNESGTFQIYLVSFPSADQKRQISTNGGVQPRWRREGKELYYLNLDGKLMAVDIRVDAKIESGVPRQLFDTKLNVDNLRDQFAATPDGQPSSSNYP